MQPSTAARPPRYTVETLLEVCVQEFLLRGYDATSMEDLARATGLTKSSIYHHVAGKEELLRRGIAPGVQALLAVFDAPVPSAATPQERLELVLQASALCLVDHLAAVTLLLRVRGNTSTERWALAQRRDLDARLAERVAAAATPGSLRAGLDPAVVARLLFGMLNSITEWFRPDGSITGEQVTQIFLTVALDGLRRAGAPDVQR